MRATTWNIVNKGIFVVISILALTLLVSSLDRAAAESNLVTLYPSGSESNETHVLYEGEVSLNLRIEFPENCTLWSVEFSSDLFQHPFSDRVVENRSKGDAPGTSVDINPEATIGRYLIDIYFNYTAEGGQEVTTNESYVMDYLRAFEIKTIVLPSDRDRELSIEIELFYTCRQINVSFSSLEIGFKDMDIGRNDLGPGTYSFNTTTYRREVSSEQPWIGYVVRIHLQDRFLIHREYSVPIDWGADDGASEDDGTPVYLVVIGVIILAIISVNFIYFRGRTG